MSRRRTEPQRLGSVVSKVYPANEPEQLQAIRAFRWWEKVVPPRVARNARPVRLRRGTLTIHVTNSTWAQELSYLRPQLLASIQRGAPEAKIKELQIRVGELPQIVHHGRPIKGLAADRPLQPAELPDDLARVL